LSILPIFCILALGSAQHLLYRLGLGPVLVYCTDRTPAVDSVPVTLFGPVPYVVTQRHCLERHRVKHEVIVWSCQQLCRRPPIVSRSYVIVLCLQSSDKWRRRLDAIDGLDWALTHLMWFVQTYLDRPKIFHINWLNLVRQIRKMATRIDRQFFFAMIDALSDWRSDSINFGHLLIRLPI